LLAPLPLDLPCVSLIAENRRDEEASDVFLAVDGAAKFQGPGSLWSDMLKDPTVSIRLITY